MSNTVFSEVLERGILVRSSVLKHCDMIKENLSNFFYEQYDLQLGRTNPDQSFIQPVQREDYEKREAS